MFVNPQGVLKIYRNIPWHSDYEHVRQFNSKEERNAFLEANKKYGFENFSYIREQRALRVEINAENLYDCNYISFQNAGFGDRIFCAFITDVKYVNTETSEIYFVLDYYQTWWYDAVVKQCFVEREHVADDTIGLHTVDENLDYGELMERRRGLLHFTNWKICVKYAPSEYWLLSQEPAWETQFIDNQPTVYMHEYWNSDSGVAQMQDDMNTYASSGCVPISVELYPGDIDEIIEDEVEHSINTYMTIPVQRYNDFVNPKGTHVEEPYTPSNAKLYCYPYTQLTISNQVDTLQTYKWENFQESDTSKLKVLVRVCKANHISIEITPNLYNTVSPTEPSRIYSLSLTTMPRVDYQVHDTLGWLKTTLNGLLGSLGTIIGGATGGGMGAKIGSAVGGGITSAGGSFIGGLSDKSQTRVGGGNNTALDVRYNMFGFDCRSMSIKAEYAKIIDNFLTRYGYKVNTLKEPELDSRERYNYVKTKGAIIENRENHSLPDEAETEIAKIFDNGVTVWHVNSIGTYGNNPIV